MRLRSRILIIYVFRGCKFFLKKVVFVLCRYRVGGGGVLYVGYKREVFFGGGREFSYFYYYC